MSDPLAALEFDRVQQLVAAFASSERGRRKLLATLPRFAPGEGSRLFRLTRETQRLVTAGDAPTLAGLDHAELLEGTTGIAEGADLARLISFVRAVVEARAALGCADLGEELSRLAAALPPLDAFLAFCDQRLGPDGEVLDTASPALAAARAARERGRAAIVAELDHLRRRHPALTAPFTVRRERYCLPVPVAERQAVAGLVLDSSSSGATVFVEPFAVVERNNALAEATARVTEEERRVLEELMAAFTRRREELLAAAETLAELDAAQARVRFGAASGGSLLEPGRGEALRLRGARHPLLDPALAALRAEVFGTPGNTRHVVPLDLDFPEDSRVLLLSGPNAGGKTVALKTLGLVALMAQAGMPVLAKEGSGLPPFSRVWCHIGDEQSLLSDLSTFTGAMRATAGLLAEADRDTLVLYDELGSGTDPEEGAALATALLEELVRAGCWAVATAHLVTVAAHVEQLPGAGNAAMGYDEVDRNPTYRFQLGLPGRSRGLDIAATCGVSPRVLARARFLLSRAYLALDTYLARLDDEREQLAREIRRLEVLQGETEERARALEAEHGRWTAAREELRGRLAEERDRLRRRAAEQLDAALAELKAARERGELPGKRRLAALRSAALSVPSEDHDEERHDRAELAPGHRVRVRGMSAEGVVGRVLGERVEVQVGAKRLWVDGTSCEPIDADPSGRTSNATVSVEEPPPGELKLLGLTEEEAREELEHFLDRALVSGLRRVRVVHGHGSGVLRRMVREVLTHHPAVTNFSHPPQYRGGTGVTEAELEG